MIRADPEVGLETNKMAVIMLIFTYFKELSCVIVAVVDTDAATKDADIEANSEISWKHWEARAVLLKDHLSLKENTLWSTAVYLLWLTDHN
jgi:hypothetical protein